jgi:PAS domain S-box-containing protein
MKYRISDLIDMDAVQRLTDLFYKVTGMVSAVLDLDGVILTGAGWQGLCTDFHRVHPQTKQRCIESDTVIANQIAAGQKFTVYRCKNGLIDAATPITIGGEHVANFFTGQFFFEPPDGEYFREQARSCGFDEDAYMEAVLRIPVIEEATLQPFLEYFSEFAAMLGDMGLKQMRQVEATASLREAEQRLATTLSSIGDAVIATDEKGRITFMNPIAERLSGWTLTEAGMKPVTEVFAIVNEHTRETVDDPVTKVLDEGMIVGLANHTVLIARNGTEVPIDDSGAPIRASDGKVVGVVLVFRDITERKVAEKALSESEEQYRLLFSANPNPMFVFDEETSRFLAVNDAAVLHYGWSREEFLAMTVLDIRPAGDKAVAREVIQQHCGAHEASIGLFRHRRKDGTLCDMDISVSSIIFAGRPARLCLMNDVTERNQREETLRRYELLSENSRDIVLLVDNNGGILEANVAATKAYGYSREELIVRSIRDLRAPGTRGLAADQMAEADEKGILFESTHLRKDGSTFPVEVSSQGTEIGGSRVLISVIRDITERKRTEEALKESEDRFRTLANATFEGIAITEHGRIVDANEQLLRIIGGTRRELIGQEVASLVKPEDRDRVMASILGGLESSIEHRMIRRDGAPIIVETHGRTIAYQGRQVRITAISDISESKRVEEELRKSRDELELRVLERTEELSRASTYNRSLLEANPDPLVTISPEGKITDVNAATELATGYSRQELLGTDFSDYFTESEKARAGYRRVFDEGLVRDYPLDIRHRDGHITPVIYNASIYRDGMGSVIGAFAAARDISGQRQLEAQLRQAQKMEALGTLSGGIAHDFNNILAAIIGFTDLLAGHAAVGSRDERHLKRVMEASLRGRELVRQMLTFSRKTEQEKKPLLLSGVVNESVRLLRASIPATISIGVETESESGMILGDPTQLQQIVMNLCTNAAYAMREKGGVLDVELSDFSVSPSHPDRHGVEPGLYMKLVVRDTGTGISPDILDKIFDPFFTTKKLGEGTGLGLSVVHGIVREGNGHITVESTPGEGSTFTIYFPKTAEEPRTEGSRGDTIPTGSERILFVDDEEALVEMGEDILAELGYDVTSRTSSTEALALLEEDPNGFDLVITDQTIPDMTGMELAREVLLLRPDMPMIMCTGFSHIVDANRAKAAGIRAFAMKPLTKREIARTIRQVLDE